MSGKKDLTRTAYANPAFDEIPTRAKNSSQTSPTGSNIFIVKPGDKKGSRSNSEPSQHDPVTQKSIGRTILRGIRCKYLIFFL